MLAEAFAAAYPDGQITIFNRTGAKAQRVAEGRRNVRVVSCAEHAVTASDTVFLATKTVDGWSVLDEIGPMMHRAQTLVTTISAIPLEAIERMTDASVAKVIPSIVQTVQSGTILVTYGPSMSSGAKSSLNKLLSSIAHPFEVAESQVRVCSDLTSCGPAFLSEILVHWADAAAATGQVTAAEAQGLLVQTVIGLADLLKSGRAFQDVITHVAIPGGVTETGILALRQIVPPVFQELHQVTQLHGQKRLEDRARSQNQRS